MRTEAQRLLGEIDWAGLADTLRARRLLTQLGPRIIELADGGADAGFQAEVEQAMNAGRRHSGFLQLVCQDLIGALTVEGIRASALKGPFFAEAIYGDPGRRLSSDVDLLVPPDRLDAAVEVVRRRGYGAPSGHLGKDGLPLLHLLLVHEQGQLPPIELHWRVHWYERSFACERLLPAAPDPSGQWRPAPADELVALLLFYARDGFIDLRLATDLSAWWDLHGAGLPAHALDRVLDAYPAFTRVLRAAARAAEMVVALPAGDLFGARGVGVRERVASRLADPNPRVSTAQLYADMGLIDGLLAPPGGLSGFVGRQLLPPREVLAQQADRAARSHPRSRITRFAGVLGRYLLAMRRLMGRVEAVG